VADALGKGTFGQVVKCRSLSGGRVVAVKVVKNKPAYYNQALLEIRLMQEVCPPAGLPLALTARQLNENADADGSRHIVRLLDYMLHRQHLCLVFELLSIDLYQLVRQNSYRGLPLRLVRCGFVCGPVCAWSSCVGQDVHAAAAGRAGVPGLCPRDPLRPQAREHPAVLVRARVHPAPPADA
jgi:serine/threonine protein kinase